jgi:hypothetical protein
VANPGRINNGHRLIKIMTATFRYSLVFGICCVIHKQGLFYGWFDSMLSAMGRVLHGLNGRGLQSLAGSKSVCEADVPAVVYI